MRPRRALPALPRAHHASPTRSQSSPVGCLPDGLKMSRNWTSLIPLQPSDDLGSFATANTSQRLPRCVHSLHHVDCNLVHHVSLPSTRCRRSPRRIRRSKTSIQLVRERVRRALLVKASLPNGTGFEPQALQTIPTYQVATTAAMPEGHMAARISFSRWMLVGSKPELGCRPEPPNNGPRPDAKTRSLRPPEAFQRPCSCQVFRRSGLAKVSDGHRKPSPVSQTYSARAEAAWCQNTVRRPSSARHAVREPRRCGRAYQQDVSDEAAAHLSRGAPVLPFWAMQRTHAVQIRYRQPSLMLRPIRASAA